MIKGWFVKKRLKINMLNIKKDCKVWNHCHYAGAYRGVAHSICDFKHSISKVIIITILIMTPQCI